MDISQEFTNEFQGLLGKGKNAEANFYLEKIVLDSLSLMTTFYFYTQDKQELAIKCLKLACEIDKGNYVLRSNLSHLLNSLERFEEAVPEALQSVKLSDSKDIGALLNCAVIMNNSGRVKDAISCYRNLLELQDDLKTRYNLACCLLHDGQFKEGWAYYESRLQAFDITVNFEKRLTAPHWQGEDLSDKTLLVYSEQGIGDLFMFCRYLPELSKICPKIILECQNSTVKLMQYNFPNITVVGRPDSSMPSPPSADFCVSICSLPYKLGNDTPGGTPYLSTSQNAVNLPQGNFKVGICWAGNPDHNHDYIRTCSFKYLKPLANIPNVTFYDFQKDKFPKRIWKYKEVNPHEGLEDFPLIDITSHLNNFYDTSVYLKQMDLVITIDTAVAHLAGALGVPVWMMVASIPDWRWTQKYPSRSIWYRSMKIYRQSTLHDWKGVVSKIFDALCLTSNETNLSKGIESRTSLIDT